MLPTSFEKIPEIILEISRLINCVVWAEIDEHGLVAFCHSPQSLVIETLFTVNKNQDVMTEFIHWKRGLNK